MKQSRTKDIFVLGFAMFAIFFGAGNLIFPPSIGINTGEWCFGIAGMTLTGILFPMLAMYAVVNMGTDFYDLSYHINSWWHQLFRGIGLLIVLFGTIPRCGAVAAETDQRGIAPDLPDWANVVFLVAFFALSYFFASNRSKVVDMIGTYATPILLIALLIIVVMVFAIPIGSPTGGTVDNAFSYSMLTAYNTGDIPTGLICAGVFLGSVKEKGYTQYKDQKAILVRSILVSHHPVRRLRRPVLAGPAAPLLCPPGYGPDCAPQRLGRDAGRAGKPGGSGHRRDLRLLHHRLRYDCHGLRLDH